MASFAAEVEPHAVVQVDDVDRRDGAVRAAEVGRMRTIQPSTSGLGTSPPWYAMLFWPGMISIGPTS